MKKLVITFMALVLIMSFTACEYKNQSSESKSPIDSNDTVELEETSAMKMSVTIEDKSFTATLEDNAATRELVKMMREAPISINLDDYSGFEKAGSLGKSLSTDNQQITTKAGDIVLYSGNQIVMFYGSNSWSYTKIWRVYDVSGWKEALGNGSVTAVFSLVE